MSVKLEEMERFAEGTNSVLNEMRQRVEDLVEETSRQRQRAAENEQELCRVKRDFESLKSYVSSLISRSNSRLLRGFFERLVAKTTQLEGEKMQKEAEVQKLMEENVRLSALLDKKEAQLLAMNEQCKVMAMSGSNNSQVPAMVDPMLELIYFVCGSCTFLYRLKLYRSMPTEKIVG
ncbi:hypothetical protein RJ641_010678 [Dillenia turbinata]|uniref:Uncharacterized protein n=1 Tax=Dillenia turbinata TaxID=194707 RepID=A0AAN8VB25_9MAGN